MSQGRAPISQIPFCEKLWTLPRFALPADESVTFVPLVTSGPIAVAPSASSRERAMLIEIGVGSIVVRVANGADGATLEAVVRAIMRAADR